MGFLVQALPDVRDQIRKQFFFYEVLYNYCFNFFCEYFVPKNGVPKNGALIVFSKKPNTPEYAKVLVVMCPKLNSVTALLSLPPLELLVLKSRLVKGFLLILGS